MLPRLSGHSGQDTQQYKSDIQIAAEKARDPLPRLQEFVIAENLMSKADWDATALKAHDDVRAALANVRQRPQHLFGIGVFSFWRISSYVALAFMVVLAIDGVRYRKPLFDLQEYTRSGYYNNFITQTETGRAMSWHYGNPLGIAYLISQALFLAPRSTVHAVKAFRSLVPTDETTVAEAAQVLRELKTQREWVPAETGHLAPHHQSEPRKMDHRGSASGCAARICDATRGGQFRVADHRRYKCPLDL